MMTHFPPTQPPLPLVGESSAYPFMAAEFFAGIGLFRMGLELAGWKIAYANDWSEERAQIYSGFFGETYQVRDVFSVDGEDVPQVTLATCSFPCIDLSLAGHMNGLDGKHSSAFWGFYDILRERLGSAIPIVLLENVTGWLSSNQGRDFYSVASALNATGYACDAFILNARSFLPQSRPRVFMIGVQEDVLGSLADCRIAIRSGRSKRLSSPRLENLISANNDINWIQLNIPEPPDYKCSGFSDTIVEVMPDDDPRWWSRQKVDKHLEMMPTAHLSMVKSLAQNPEEISRTFFRRRRRDGQKAEVRKDDIAGCLRTAVGGSGKQFLVSVGAGKIRMRTLTPREYARLQGVPDSLPIKAATERQSLNAFGDAVCVPVVSWIADHVLTPVALQLGGKV